MRALELEAKYIFIINIIRDGSEAPYKVSPKGDTLKLSSEPSLAPSSALSRQIPGRESCLQVKASGIRIYIYHLSAKI